MVDVVGRAKVIVSSDVDTKSLNSTSSKIGAGLRKGAVVGAAALGTLAVAGFKAFQSFEEAESASRKLNQVLDNMGESKAGPAVEKLADDLRKLTGVDDEVIKGGQTILATFSEVAKSAGDVGGAFEQATELSLDLAASGFGNVDSAAKSLGKALQDPTKGIGALSRAGVTFTAAQKEVIKGLVETGEIAEAQEIILKEVAKQVGGTAEAGATESQKISTAMGEIKETLGFFVADLVSGEDETSSFADSLERVNTELDELSKSEGWETTKEVLRATGGAIGFVTGKIGDFLAAAEDTGERVGTQIDNMLADWKRWKDNVGRFINNVGVNIRNAPDRIGQNLTKWARLGANVLSEFISGFASGAVPVELGQKIKDAINQALPDSIPFFGGRGGLPPIEVAVPQFASGTRNFTGGLAVVGERGPELVNLPAGSDVYSNTESKALTGDTYNYTAVYNGPESAARGRREADWWAKHGTRFGAATSAGVPA